MRDRVAQAGVFTIVCCGVLATAAALATAATVLWLYATGQIAPEGAGAWSTLRGGGAIGLTALMIHFALRCFGMFADIIRDPALPRPPEKALPPPIEPVAGESSTRGSHEATRSGTPPGL